MDDITVVLHKCPFVDASCAVSMQVFFIVLELQLRLVGLGLGLVLGLELGLGCPH